MNSWTLVSIVLVLVYTLSESVKLYTVTSPIMTGAVEFQICCREPVVEDELTETNSSLMFAPASVYVRMAPTSPEPVLLTSSPTTA